MVKTHFFICNGGSCLTAGAEETTLAIRKTIARLGKDIEIHTTRTLCNGRCQDAPVVIIMPDNIWYKEMMPQIAEKMVIQHIEHGLRTDSNLLFEYPTHL